MSDQEHVGDVGEWMSAEQLSDVALAGDLIEMDRLNGTFQHWSVCVLGAGCEKAVLVHVTGDVMTGLGALVRTRDTVADIRVEGLVYAVGEDKCRYNNSIDGRFEPFESTEIVRRGLCKVGQFDYSAWSNNCEHWASWCRNGHTESLQVEHIKKEMEQWESEQKSDWKSEMKSISEMIEKELSLKRIDKDVEKMVGKIKYKRKKEPPPPPNKEAEIVVKLSESTLQAFPMLLHYNEGGADSANGNGNGGDVDVERYNPNEQVQKFVGL